MSTPPQLERPEEPEPPSRNRSHASLFTVNRCQLVPTLARAERTARTLFDLPTPRTMLDPIRFVSPSGQGFPLDALLNTSRDALQTTVPGYTDPSLLEIGLNTIQFKPYWPKHDQREFTYLISLVGPGGAKCAGELAIAVARAYKLFFESIPPFKRWYEFAHFDLLAIYHLAGDVFHTEVQNRMARERVVPPVLRHKFVLRAPCERRPVLEELAKSRLRKLLIASSSEMGDAPPAQGRSQTAVDTAAQGRISSEQQETDSSGRT